MLQITVEISVYGAFENRKTRSRWVTVCKKKTYVLMVDGRQKSDLVQKVIHFFNSTPAHHYWFLDKNISATGFLHMAYVSLGPTMLN